MSLYKVGSNILLASGGGIWCPPGSEDGSPLSFDFDSGTTGASVGTYLDDRFGTNGVFAIDQAYSGKSMKTICPSGTTGFDQGFGYYLRLKDGNGDPANLVLGDEIWWRTRTYFDSTYSFNDTNFAQKFFRVKTNAIGQDPVNDGGQGHIDTYIERPANGDNAFHFVYEAQDSNEYFGSYSGGTCCHTEQWETFEVYVKLGTNSGNSKMMFWRNGTRIGESTSIYTLSTSTDFVGALLFFTLFNGGAPHDEIAWLDDVTYYHTKGAGGTPPNTDAGGHPYIGTG